MTTNEKAIIIIGQIISDIATLQARLVEQHGYRSGQALFMAVDSYAPEIAKIIGGTPIDPYYDDSVVPGTWGYLADALVHGADSFR